MEVMVVNGANMLLTYFSGLSNSSGSELRDLMEKIYRSYCRKLDEKAVLRRKMQRKGKEVVEYVP